MFDDSWRRITIVSTVASVFITACVILTGLVVTPVAIAATFAASFASVLAAINIGLHVAMSRMDLAENVLAAEELEALNRQVLIQNAQRLQAIAPRQQVADFLQREIAAGNPMWAFMAPKPPVAASPIEPKMASDIEGYMVGGHNLRKRKN